MTKRDKLLRAAIALCLVAAAPPTKAGAGDKGAAWQLFVWLKNGEKTGYLFADKPEFRLEGDMVKFQTVGEAMDIVKSDLDKFTVEQVLPTDPVGIALPETFLLGLKRSAQLNCTLQPADALTTLTWFNSNPAVASIGNGGLVTGLQPGETTVKVQTSNGLRAACLVTVPVPRYRLVVWKTNGRHDAYPFTDKPEITRPAD